MQYTTKPTEKDRALFLKNLLPLVSDPKAIPFGLTVGERTLRGFGRLPVTVTCEQITSSVVRRTFTARLKKEKLEISAETLEYKDFPTVEWVVSVKNVGKTNSPQITDFSAASALRLAAPNAKLHHNNGDYYNVRGLETTVSPLLKGESMTFSPFEGRSCNGAFPYYRIECPNHGYNLAIGWSGQWEATFTGGNNHAFVTAKQKTLNTYLRPGEVVRSPRICLEVYQGGTERGVNTWRRFYISHVMPKWQGEDLKPLLIMHDNGSDFPPDEVVPGAEWTRATEAQQLNAIQKFTEKGFKFDLWWIDAGWYNCYVKEVDRKVWTRTADWDADKNCFPNEFTKIRAKLKELGSRFLLWFEPERMCWWHMEGAGMAKEYAWYLNCVDKDGNPYVDETALFKLADGKAFDYIFGKIDGMIKRNGIDVYRQDFNMDPMPIWKANDEENRAGMMENAHTLGYYRLWDKILTENDGILIDSCASGGRRNDFESMRRAVPLHYTDCGYGNHPVKEAFSRTMFSWIPYFRNHTMNWDYTDGNYYDSPDRAPEGVTRFADDKIDVAAHADNYGHHTGFAPALGCVIGWSASEEKAAECIQRNELWRRAAAYTQSGDFYPLTPYTKSPDSWYVLQFHDEEKDEGVVNAVRNTRSSEETYLLQLRQMDEKADYVLEIPEENRTLTVSGKTLAKGYEIALPKRSGAYLFYRKVR